MAAVPGALKSRPSQIGDAHEVDSKRFGTVPFGEEVGLTVRRRLEGVRQMPVQGKDAHETMERLARVRTALEALLPLGEAAVPELARFLDSGQDRFFPVFFASPATMDVNAVKQTDGQHDWLGPRSGRVSRDLLAFSHPPSLRIGVIMLLGRIGGKPALESIRNGVSRSFRAGEIAVCDRVFGTMLGSDGFHSMCQARARQIAGIAPPVESGDFLAARHKDYILLLLEESDGDSYVQVAAAQLIRVDGTLDLRVLDGAVEKLKERVVPLLKQAYQDERLTDGRHRAHLAGLATDYFGSSAAATEFVEYVVRDDSMPTVLKMMVIQSLNGYNMFSKRYVSLTSGEMAFRAGLLKSLAATSGDLSETVRGAIERTAAQLGHQSRPPNGGE